MEQVSALVVSEARSHGGTQGVYTHANVTEKGEYRAACAAAGIPAEIRMQPGYDHSYYFISSFLAEHVAWHAARLRG